MDNKEVLATTIKSLRKRNGITQKELSYYTGISLPSIIAYENKQREPNSKAMVALEKYFDVSGSYLRGESEMKWQDSSIMNAINDNLADASDSLISICRNGSNQNISDVFDILVELRHAILKDSKQDYFDISTFVKDIIISSIKCVDRFIDYEPDGKDNLLLDQISLDLIHDIGTIALNYERQIMQKKNSKK